MLFRSAGAEHETGKDEAWREGIVFRSSRMAELIEEARGVKDAPVIGPNQKGLFDGQPTEPPPGSPGR